MNSPSHSKPRPIGLVAMSWIGLSLASGFAALVYQVLWVKQVTNIYGSTAFAVSTTLVAFFLGLSAGSFFLGKQCSHLKSPFKALALVELGIGLGNVLIYLLMPQLESISVSFWVEGGANPLHAVVTFSLVLLLLFPTSFFLGGTYPIMVQAHGGHCKSKVSTAIYSLNTGGACLGALMGGTLLPIALGYVGTGLLALAITTGVAISAWILGLLDPKPVQSSAPPLSHPSKGGREELFMGALAFISGFASLGLEVVWTHMFAQVLQNSVYTYACILTLFLMTQALGAAGVTMWTRKRDLKDRGLGIIISSIGFLVLLTPFLFQWSTQGITYLGFDKDQSFVTYLLDALAHIGWVLLLPSLAMGCLFPILIHWCFQKSKRIGEDLGRWVSINTLGAILGSLVTGFVFIPQLSTWSTIRILGCFYVFLLFLPKPSSDPSRDPSPIWMGGLLFFLSISLADPTQLPLINIGKDQGEVLLHLEEDEEGVVAVVEKNGHRNIVVNNSYTLGGTKSAKMEELQSHLPLVVMPRAKSIFYLGMGTGITSGASLKYPVEEVVITELVGNSIRASQLFFEDWNGGIFKDPRARVLHGDGRQILKHHPKTHDLIIADLFIPWKKGTGNLYTSEHFHRAHSRLNPGGAYAQWLPLYQLTRADFDAIAKTMLEAFPQITVWRGDFYNKRPILCLLGHREAIAFDPTSLAQWHERYNPLLLRKKLHPDHPKAGALFKHYIGCLNPNHPQWARAAINTENHPWIEFRTPIHHRQVEAGSKTWFNQRDYLEWMESFIPTHREDPFLNGNTDLMAYANLGLAHHRLKIYEQIGTEEEKRRGKAAMAQAIQSSLSLGP